jgi:hypothetical protein
VREELLRTQVRARGSVQARVAGEKPPAPPPAAASQRSIAEYGVLAIAIAYPDLRDEILAIGVLPDFEDRGLAVIAVEICGGGKESAQALIAQRLSPEQQSVLSAQMIDPMLETAEKARFVLGEYQRTLVWLRQEKQMRERVRTAREQSGIEAQTQKAQEAVLLARERQKLRSARS